MKILHTNMLRGWGGQSNRILTEVRGSIAAGHQVAVCAPTMAPLLEKSEKVGAEVWRGYQFKPPFQFWYSMPDLRRLVRAVRAWRPDVIHMHGSQDTWLVVLARKVLGTECPPLIRSRHNTVAWKTHTANLWLYRNIDAYVGISEACRDRLNEYPGLRGKPMVTIPSVPNLQRFDGRAPTRVRHEFSIPPDAFLWGRNARMRPEKAYDVLLDAFALVRAARPHAMLLACGEGSDLGAMRERARALGLGEDAAILPGFRNDAPDVLSALDAYVHPSREEGLGTAILEALSVGLPVVATRVGGIPESVIHEKTGLLCEVDNPRALADAMIRMMDEPDLRERVAQEGRRHVRENFSETSLVARTNAFYQHVIDLHRNGKLRP